MCAQGSAFAQMSDPMQPSGASRSTGESSAPRSSGLRIVITSPSRNLALIDGVVVPVGGPVRNGTLAAVSESVAVLKKNGTSDVLLMHPEIDKKPSRRERP
jgi:hypothetical protein